MHPYLRAGIPKSALLWFLAAWLLATGGCHTARLTGLFHGSEGFFVAESGGSYLVFTAQGRQRLGGYPDASAAIQAAIDKLPPGGGEVCLGAGKFLLSAPLQLRSYSTLSGKGAATRILAGAGWAGGKALLVAQEADQERVERLGLVAPYTKGAPVCALLASNSGEFLAKDLYVFGPFEYGIVFRKDMFLSRIEGCHLAGMSQSAIFLDSLDQAGRCGDFLPNSIANCMIFGSHIGIEARNAIMVNITGCTVFQTKSHAFFLHSISNSVLISGCRTFQIGSDALYLRRAWEANLTGNIFCWHEGHGIVLDEMTWGVITGNNIIDNGSMNLYALIDSNTVARYPLADTWLAIPHGDSLFPDKAGIYMKNNVRGMIITSNAIWNWPLLPPMKYGIEADSTCHHNIISLNSIDFARDGGIWMPGPDNLVRDNLEHLGRNYLAPGSDKWQSFDLRLLRDYQRQLLDMAR